MKEKYLDQCVCICTNQCIHICNECRDGERISTNTLVCRATERQDFKGGVQEIVQAERNQRPEQNEVRAEVIEVQAKWS